MDKIEYDFYENPNSKSDNSKSKYHIRICRRQKISTKSILGTESGVVDGLENGKNVVLKSVNIRPLPEFVDIVKEALKPRVKSRGFHSSRISDAEIEASLTDYFKENESITRSIVEQRFRINRTRAAQILKRLVQEGKLRNIGFSNHPKYVPVEDKRALATSSAL